MSVENTSQKVSNSSAVSNCNFPDENSRSKFVEDSGQILYVFITDVTDFLDFSVVNLPPDETRAESAEIVCCELELIEASDKPIPLAYSCVSFPSKYREDGFLELNQSNFQV